MCQPTQLRNCSCSQCGKDFELKGNLKILMSTHTGEKNCSCIENFTYRGNLKILIPTQTGEKNCSCN